jgi:hypothetical protein
MLHNFLYKPKIEGNFSLWVVMEDLLLTFDNTFHTQDRG